MSSRSEERGDERHPRGIIHDAQQQAHQWQHVCLGARAQYADASPELAARGFHNAVIHYWSILRPYRDEKALGGAWGDEDTLQLAPYRIGELEIQSLEELGKLRYATVETRDVDRDPLEGTTVRKGSAPGFLTPEQSSDVLDALNDIARELGLGIHIRPGVDEDPLPV